MASTLSVSNFLSNPGKLSAISDSAVNVASSLDLLQSNVANIKSIALTGSKPQLTVSSAQLVSDSQVLLKIAGSYAINLSDAATPTLSLSWTQYSAELNVLGKIAAAASYNLSLSGVPAAKVSTLGTNSHVSAFTVQDTAANVAGNLAALGKYEGKIASVTISDTGAHLGSSLTALANGFSKLSQLKINLTDSVTPTLKLTAAQVTADASVLKAIASPYAIQIVDTAQNISNNLTTLEAYSSKISNISLTGSGAGFNLTAAQYNANSDVLAEINGHYNLTVSGQNSSATPQLSPFTMRAPVSMTGAVVLTASVSINGAAPVNLGSVTTNGSAAVQFQPQNMTPAAGDSWTISVTATDASGKSVPGQVEMTSGYFSGVPVNNGYAAQLNVKFLSVSAAGVVSGLPKAYSATDAHYYVLEGAASTSLALADKSSSVLHQYILAGKVAAMGVTDAVQSQLVNAIDPVLKLNASTIIPNLGNALDAGQYAIMANIPNVANSTTVQMWLSDGTSTYQLATQSVSAAQPFAGFSGADLNINSVVLPAGSGATGTSYKLFFTDGSGNGVPGSAISGLQLAISSAAGGAPGQWISAPATASTGITLEVGTVAQIMAYAAANPTAPTWYFVEDSINNIQTAGSALSNLVNAHQVLGAYISGGIAPAGNGYLMSQWPAPVQIGSSSQFVRVFGTDTGNWQTHTALAVPTTDSNVTHTVQLFDNGVALGGVQALTSDGSSTLGVALPTGITLIAGSSHYLTATLDGTAVNLGLVSSAGGLPAAYSAGINVWVGAVSALPSSLSGITSNTLYVVQDTAANLVALSSSALETGVVLNLAASGNLLFEVSGGQLTTYQQQFIEENNLSILNLSSLTIQDTLLGLEHVPVINAGDSLQINDDAAHVLYAANAIEAVYPTSGATGQHNPLSMTHATVTDTLSSLLDGNNQAALQALHGGISNIVVADSVADFTAGSFGTVDHGLQQFATGLGATLGLTVKDSLANLQASLAQQFLSNYSANVDVIDNVGNLESAYANGALTALAAAEGKTGFTVEVKDNLANLKSLFGNVSELGLYSHLQNVTVVDTAQNIDNSLQNPGSSLNPLTFANNIIIQDSYSNVLAESQANNSLLGQVSEIALSNGAASGQGALQINLGNSVSGFAALPELVLSFMSGSLSATEAADGNGGTLVTITDTNNHSVSVDLIGVTDNGAYTHGGWYHV